MNRQEIGRRQANDFISQLESEGVTPQDIQRIQENKPLRRAVVDIITKGVPLLTDTTAYIPLIVDDSLSIYDILRESGCESWSKDLLDAQLHSRRPPMAVINQDHEMPSYFARLVLLETKDYRVPRHVTTAQMEKAKMYPATIRELGALHRQFPQFCKGATIVGLGTLMSERQIAFPALVYHGVNEALQPGKVASCSFEALPPPNEMSKSYLKTTPAFSWLPFAGNKLYFAAIVGDIREIQKSVIAC